MCRGPPIRYALPEKRWTWDITRPTHTVRAAWHLRYDLYMNISETQMSQSIMSQIQTLLLPGKSSEHIIQSQFHGLQLKMAN